MNRDFSRTGNRDFARSANRDRGFGPVFYYGVIIDFSKFGWADYQFGGYDSTHPDPSRKNSDRYSTMRVRAVINGGAFPGMVEERLTYSNEFQDGLVFDDLPTGKLWMNYELLQWTFPIEPRADYSFPAFGTDGLTIASRTKDHISLTGAGGAATLDIWLENRISGISELNEIYGIANETGNAPSVLTEGELGRPYLVDEYKRQSQVTVFHDNGLSPFIEPSAFYQIIGMGAVVKTHSSSVLRHGVHTSEVRRGFIGSSTVKQWTVFSGRFSGNLSPYYPLEELDCSEVTVSGFLPLPELQYYIEEEWFPAVKPLARYGFPIHAAPERFTNPTIVPTCYPQAYP